MPYWEDEIDYEALAEIGFYAFEIKWSSISSELVPNGATGTLTCATEEDARYVAAWLLEKARQLDILFDFEIRNRINRKWIAAYDHSKMRVAPPYHRVFIVVGGTDCDGVSWCSYYSFKHLEEAQEEMDEILSWADGPTNYQTLSLEDWEQGEYPVSRDVYAERAGY